ncbi:MAG: MerR family transcriptional regulator [Rickettsiales bacterium]|nr:MerR family transcriptional regulator [Rickettsiales bacterium]
MNSEYFLSISDVSKKLGIPAHTLRYWEKQFPAAVKPATGAGGRRYYRAETVGALAAIKNLLYARGMTIAGVKKLVKEGALQSGADFAAGANDADYVKKQPENSAPDNSALFSQKAYIGQAIDLLKRARAVLE